jgi:hypothetical protein
MVGQTNIENEIILMLMEWRIIGVEDIVGDLSKEVDGLVDLCLKYEE